MLRKFKIKIDGKEYLVEMEEEGAVQVPLAQPAQPAQPAPVAATPEVAATPAPAPESAPTAAEEGAILAPMLGAIIKLLVQVGDTVEANQPVMVLEAMKMENQIVSDHSGTVKGIHVSTGDIVNPGDALITIA